MIVQKKIVLNLDSKIKIERKKSEIRHFCHINNSCVETRW